MKETPKLLFNFQESLGSEREIFSPSEYADDDSIEVVVSDLDNSFERMSLRSGSMQELVTLPLPPKSSTVPKQNSSPVLNPHGYKQTPGKTSV